MLLVDAQIHGFRRFGGEAPHKLLVDARVVCLIGANEAGKSSLLDVLAAAHSSSAIAPADRTRRETVGDDRPVVTLRYRLDDQDREAVANLYGDHALPRWFSVVKRANGSLTFTPDQKPPRNRAARKRAIESLRNDESRSRLAVGTVDAAGDEEQEAEAEPVLQEATLTALVNGLDEDDLSAETLQLINESVEQLRAYDETELAEVLEGVASEEQAPHPIAEAQRRLWNRTPDFVAFSEDERNLLSEYDLADVASDPPIALANLAQLAGLNLVEALSTIQNGESGTVEFLERQANAKLASVFSEWSQRPPIEVTINLSGTLLYVHVTTGTDVPMRLTERSEGLREFVALVAATAQSGYARPPILLIDEIETHLHYDAQIDLLRIIVSQTIGRDGNEPSIGQVIYTTHSAACLPEDLGSVRVVEAHAQRTRSRIRNQFWTDEPGLGPLLMAMGAASLAFVPRRPAVVAEGASELILLPTLIKQATGLENLGYQIAPGASSARPGSIIGFDLQAPRTVWVVDSDNEGPEIARKLIGDGIQPERVLYLGGEGAGLMLEDLVDVDAYLDAVAAYLADKGSDATIAKDSLGSHRPRAVEQHCESIGVKPPSKVAVANRLVSMRSERRIVAAEHADLLTALHAAFSRIILD